MKKETNVQKSTRTRRKLIKHVIFVIFLVVKVLDIPLGASLSEVGWHVGCARTVLIIGQRLLRLLQEDNLRYHSTLASDPGLWNCRTSSRK